MSEVRSWYKPQVKQCHCRDLQKFSIVGNNQWRFVRFDKFLAVIGECVQTIQLGRAIPTYCAVEIRLFHRSSVPTDVREAEDECREIIERLVEETFGRAINDDYFGEPNRREEACAV